MMREDQTSDDTADGRAPGSPAATGATGSDGMSRPPRRRPEAASEAQRLERLLPRVIANSAQAGGLSEPLVPAVERALTQIGHRDNRTLARLLAPHMGRALGRAVVEGLRDALHGLNYFMLCHLSLRGWRWRFEAYRRGIPFRDVVVERTLTTPVKQVFLIHRETGLLLQEVRSAIVGMRDWDMVSGMLTALQDFVQDSFSLAESERLDTIRMGNAAVLIEHGEHASLAGVLQGEAHAELREQFREVLRQIHSQFPRQLAAFDGDTDVFGAARPVLERCLATLVSRERIPMLLPTWAALLLPLVALAFWAVPTVQEGVLWRRYVAALDAQPGLVVLDAGRRDGRYYLTGLRDPAAQSPYELQSRMGLGALVVESRWEAYQGLGADTMLARAHEMLAPPATVSMEVRDGVLVLWGAAPMSWIERAETLLSGWTGASAYDLERLIPADLDREQKWKRYVALLVQEPGIVVVREGVRGGRFFVQGLRDPLAADPLALLPRFGMAADDVDSHWDAYTALHPDLALKRAQRLLRPPEGVTLAMQGSLLRLQGTAPRRWIQEALLLARSIPGVEGLDSASLVDRDAVALRQLAQDIEAMQFRFLVGSPDLWEGQGQKLTLLIELCRKLHDLAVRSRVPFVIEIRGHALSVGAGETETAVSAALARSFYQMLQWQRVDTRDFATVGLGNRPPPGGFPEATGSNRMVSLAVVLLDE